MYCCKQMEIHGTFKHYITILFLLPRRRMQRLGASKITQVDFLPKEVVSYSKETQTLTAHMSEGEYLCVCVCVCA